MHGAHCGALWLNRVKRLVVYHKHNACSTNVKLELRNIQINLSWL